ncbi:MAG: metalloregulator ArsR/SmtB family transcription factor [Acidimicrobiia bacterium]|nr:metalloregulator ArsR/SmtB family transcription factor [Acidimicrobiia bacterium]
MAVPTDSAIDTQEAAVASTPCCVPLFGSAFDEEAAEEMAVILKTLADPIRLRLVSIIGTAPAGEACACDLPELVERSQPTVSHHLGQLVKAGILDREQRGKWAWFRINGERLESVRRALDLSCC